MAKPMTPADEIKHWKYPELSRRMRVIVTRSVRGLVEGGGPWTEGAQTIDEALKAGRLSSAGGVDVHMAVAEGALAGCNVFSHRGRYYARFDNQAGQYDPKTDTIDPDWIEYQRELKAAV